MRVLVVDDNVDAAFVLAMLLRHLGCRVEVCQEASQCQDIAKRLQPHLVLLDLAMPRHNGFHVATTLRDGTLSPFLLVAHSGRGEAIIRDRCKAEGFDAFLLKPASLEHIQDVLASVQRQIPGSKQGVKLMNYS